MCVVLPRSAIHSTHFIPGVPSTHVPTRILSVAIAAALIPLAASAAGKNDIALQQARGLRDSNAAAINRAQGDGFVDKSGKVEASGTHEQLMAQGGRYAELFELQAAGYR